jgi:hypothetical protein
MKFNHLTILALIGVSLAACNSAPKKEVADIYTDTLTYQFKAVNSKADDCAGKPDSTCTTVKFKYPAFDNQPLLNDTVVTGLAMLMDRQKGIAALPGSFYRIIKTSRNKILNRLCFLRWTAR